MNGFVGREAELGALDARLDAARGGCGGVVMLAGEPGIGKTRTAREFSEVAAARGALVAWGRSFEGDWAPAYGPWRELVGACLGDRAALPDELGPDAIWLAQLVPAGAGGLRASAPPALGPEEERYRLYDAVARLLTAVARERPLVLILDDLHWADRASLGLVRHVSHILGDQPILLLGTYRDLELHPEHPLTELLASLRRETRFERLQLKGLSPLEVAGLVGGDDRRVVGADLANLIHAETSGNPFFVEEVVRHLREEGRLVARDDCWVVTGSGLGIPEGVRQVVGRRLARLSLRTNRMLRAAAAFSAGFDFRVLQTLTELTDEELLDSLDEALAAQIVRPVGAGGERYDFVHTIVRATLYDDLSPSRRVRLHRRAAEALARAYAGHEPEHAAELAAQYHASASLPGADAGLPYALLAAAEAKRAFARERVVTFLRIARDLAGQSEPQTQAAILRDLAVAEAEAASLDDARRTADTALATMAEADAAPTDVAGFLARVARPLKEAGADRAVVEAFVGRGLKRLGETRGWTWARLTLLGDPIEPVAAGAINAGRWRGFDPRAVAIARDHGNEDDYARSLESFDVRSRDETAALIALARTWEEPTAILRGLTIAANDLQYRHGAFREAVALWEEVLGLAERFGALFWQEQACHQLTFLHLTLGEFAQGRALEARARGLLTRLGRAREPDAIAMEMEAAVASFFDGDWERIATFFARLVADPVAMAGELGTLGVLYAGWAAVASVRAGNAQRARDLLAALTPVLERADQVMCNHNGAVALAGEAVWLLGLSDLAPAYRRLARNLIAAGFGDYPQTSIPLTAARMAALLGDAAEAEQQFDAAEAALAASGQQPLRAIATHDRALALLRADRAQPERVIALLDAAQTDFERLGMARWAQRAGEERERVAATIARAAYPAGLTEREVAVLRLVARGHSDRQISDALFISPRTVNAHLRNMLDKTGANNRMELTMWAISHGIVSPDVGN